MTTDRNDEGSALILALVMITVIAVMMAAALTFTDTSLIATPKLVDHRDDYNVIDGAMEGAINAVRGSATLGVDGAPLGCNFPDADPSDGVNVTVTCTPQANSGGSSGDQPTFAVLTLGTAAGEGFIQSGNTQLTVDGGLYSNGVLDLTPGGAQAAMLAFGDVFVEGACTPAPGTLLDSAGGLVKCDYKPLLTTPVDTRGDDPNYPPGVPSVSGLAVDPLASCASSNSVVAFSPGVYTEIPAAPSGCNGSVWWFQPGDYYFDFPDITGRYTWTPDDLSGKTVVGGTLKSGWSASTLASAITVPGACDTTKNGVQFIFGGPSLLNITSHGQVELCGSVSATNFNNHKIAFYGLKTEPARTSVGPTTLAQTGTPVSPGPAGEGSFISLDPNAMKTIDNSFAAAAVSTTGNTLDEADIKDLSFADVPDGARIEKVELRVRHNESVNQIDSTAFITLPNGTTDSKVLSNFKPTDCTTSVATCLDTWDITSLFTGKQGYSQVNGLTARYYAKVKGNNPAATASFDGMELRVTYTPIGFEQHRCPTGASGCSIVTSTVDQNLFFHGTVYVPTGALDLRVNNKDTTIFDRGIIARSVKANISASSKQVDSPFQLPTATTGREVLFVARVDGVDKLRALVQFQDFNSSAGTSSAFPGYKVTVKKWSVIR